MIEATILVVEDDKEVNDLICKQLEKQGYKTIAAYDGEKALKIFFHQSIDLVILDIMLPLIDGIEVMTKIREKSNVSILILSAKSDEVDKVIGLRLGADDYLAKPFSIRELVARTEAILRRSITYNNQPLGDEKVMTFRNLKMNTDTYQVWMNDEEIILTGKEFEILHLLIKHPLHVFTKAQIFEHVWGDPYMSDENTMMVHIRRLRKKIEPDPSHPTYIQTVWGIGYKLGDALNQ
jgi:DNA-binding response OmpR family regulator